MMKNKNPGEVPAYLYAAGLFLIAVGLGGGFCFEPERNMWNNQPQEWADLVKAKAGEAGDVEKRARQGDCSKAKGLVEYNGMEGIPLGQDRGSLQKRFWAGQLNAAYSDLALSEVRLCEIRTRLQDEKSTLFLSARNGYEEEKKFNEALRDKIERMKISTAKKYYSGMSAVFALSLLIYLAAGYFLRRTAYANIVPMDLFDRWKTPYALFLCGIFIPSALLVVYTSIFETEKHWIGPSSFFVSWRLWLMERVAMLGLGAILAIPATQLWCYTRRELVPCITPHDLTRPASKAAYERYVNFLQEWTLVMFIGFAVITVGLVRWASSHQNAFDSAYLLLSLAGLALISVLVGRMIGNALKLRDAYHEALSAGFKSFKEMGEAGIMPDPSVVFIGENWWKLPANFVGILSVVWAMLEWGGVSNIFLGALK